MRFGLKSICVGALLFAVFYVVCLKAGILVTIGVVFVIAAFAWAVRFQRRGYFLIPRVVVAVLSLIAIWFLAVDWSWYYRECGLCKSRFDVTTYRVLGFEVDSHVWYEKSIYAEALADLGDPCEHENIGGFHKHRFWGLVVCAYPCWNGSIGWGPDDRYTAEVSARVRELGKSRPELVGGIRTRLAAQDRLYFADVLMTDMFAPDVIAQPTTQEAIEWLGDSTKEVPRHIAQLDLEQSFALIEELYDAGALEVFVVEPEEEVHGVGYPYTLADEEEAGLYGRVYQDSRLEQRCSRLLVKLPQDAAQRKRLIALTDSKEKFRAKYPTADGGQEYLDMELP